MVAARGRMGLTKQLVPHSDGSRWRRPAHADEVSLTGGVGASRGTPAEEAEQTFRAAATNQSAKRGARQAWRCLHRVKVWPLWPHCSSGEHSIHRPQPPAFNRPTRLHHRDAGWSEADRLANEGTISTSASPRASSHCLETAHHSRAFAHAFVELLWKPAEGMR